MIDRLRAAHDMLATALGGSDVAAIEAANSEMNQAIAELRALGGWHARVQLRPAIAALLETAEGLAGRINYLADSNRRRLDRLAAATGAPRAQAYGRSGRLA